MGPRPIGTPTPDVTVEYDSRGKRTTKTFSCMYAARRFYTAKAKSGHNPKIARAEYRDDATTSTSN